MERILSLFSPRNLFFLSLALNVSLMMKLLNEDVRIGLDSFAIGNQSRAPTMADEEDRVINLDIGDPTMYEDYWEKMAEKTTIVIPGWQSISYFSDRKNLCWFLEPEFADQVFRLHRVVGNAVTEGRRIVVGTGSSQLYLAALYALSSQGSPSSLPVSVVSEAPFYSSYPAMTGFLKSGLFEWAGDARTFAGEGPYIEVVTSPNNPDGFVRQATVNRAGGFLIHDLAYYWPQYTPITSPADYDISLFTVSKCTGHAGTRIGWALVKDENIAKKMTKFIELNTIGVSKDSQLRAAKFLQTLADSGPVRPSDSFFAFSRRVMEERWAKLRAAVNHSRKFSLPEFSPAHCNFFGNSSESRPAFAWLKCGGDTEDCESFLRRHKILSRGGRSFGVCSKYARISMLDRNKNFNLFVDRISKIQS